MNKSVALLLALFTLLALSACGAGPTAPAAETPAAPRADTAAEPAAESPAGIFTEPPAEVPAVAAADRSDYTIRIYSNSNPPDRTEWLISAAAEAGFLVSIDDNSVISGDSGAIQAAGEYQDGDVIFGLNEARWNQLVNGGCDNLSLLDWEPSWADAVDGYRFGSKAYGLTTQNVLLLYRSDELGTDGKTLRFEHWADVVDCGCTWYRQNRIGGTTNAGINAAILYAFTDPGSPAGGISVDGWKTLWRFCAEGVSGGAEFNYGFDPLNRGDVAVSAFYSSALYGKLSAAAESSEHPLIGSTEPVNWDLVDIDDGTYYISEYIGILNKAGRTSEQTETVKAFCEWFGSAEVQAAWAQAYGLLPCSRDAAALLYGGDVPAIYRIPNFALNTVPGADMTYAAYAAVHADEWTSIMTNLNFYWSEGDAPAEPEWDELDWAALTRTDGA